MFDAQPDFASRMRTTTQFTGIATGFQNLSREPFTFAMHRTTLHCRSRYGAFNGLVCRRHRAAWIRR